MKSVNEFYIGLIRLHILHHAAQGDLFGFGMIKELRRHGYELSPGTLYPILHRLERSGYILSHEQPVGGRVRRVYGITPVGRQALHDARQKVRDLFSELLEDDRPSAAPHPKPCGEGQRERTPRGNA